MKNLLTKTALIFLGIVLLVILAVNSYVMFITYKLSQTPGLFDKLQVVVDYKVFQNLGIGAFSMLLTVILLSIMFFFVGSALLKKKSNEN